MLFRRKLILMIAMVLVVVPVGATIGFGAYLRSELYRSTVEEWLTTFFELPATLGRVSPRSLTSRVFEDVELWLPDRRARIFACRQAVWAQRAGSELYELDIRDGSLTIGSEAWQLSDYRHVLYSGLSHDFSSLNLAEVRLVNIDLKVVRRGINFIVSRASGTVVFEPGELDGAEYGRAMLWAHSLNGQRVEKGIRILARFSPLGGLTLHDVTLDVPWIPVSALGIDGALRTRITDGEFRGQISYREQNEAWELQLTGEVRNVLLREFTQRLPGGPLSGRMDLSIDDLYLHDGVPRRLRFRGHLREVALAPLAALLGGPRIEGTGDLIIESARIEDGRIRQLSLRGAVDGVSLKTITARLGQGVITGQLSLAVNSLHVVDNEIRAADIDVIAVPPAGGTGTIDRTLIIGALNSLMGIDLSRLAPLLPEKVPYVKFGVKCLVDDGTLRFLGTHGPRGETILTVRVLGRDWPIFDQPSTSIELKPLLDQLERQARELDLGDLRQWWLDRQARASQSQGSTSDSP